MVVSGTESVCGTDYRRQEGRRSQIFMLYGAYRRCSGWRRKALASAAFSGQVDEGFVWGRGATDMKGSVGAWMSALEKLKAGKGDGVNLTIGTLITGDEEWAAVNGSDKVLAWMKANGKIPMLLSSENRRRGIISERMSKPAAAVRWSDIWRQREHRDTGLMRSCLKIRTGRWLTPWLFLMPKDGKTAAGIFRIRLSKRWPCGLAILPPARLFRKQPGQCGTCGLRAGRAKKRCWPICRRYC